MSEDCLACDLSTGRAPLPGGCLWRGARWRIEFCVGPFPEGTLILKPIRHVTALAALTAEERTALGPLLAGAAEALQQVLEPSQVYSTLWSHAGFAPSHLHFVLQPVWTPTGPVPPPAAPGAASQRSVTDPRPGPALQVALFMRRQAPDATALEALAPLIRAALLEVLGREEG